MARKSIDFEGMIKSGERDGGPIFQTSNGTSRGTGTGNNRQYNWEAPQVTPSPLWPGGRTNRSGE